MSDVVAVYEKYDEMVCDTYLNYVEYIEYAHALLPDDDAEFDKVLKFRTARTNAFRYWNGESANPTSGMVVTGTSGDEGSGGSGNVQEDKVKKMEKRMEKLQETKKALQKAVMSSSSSSSSSSSVTV